MSSIRQSSRLPSYSKIAFGSVATIGSAGSADAAIVFFDVNPNQTITAGQSVVFGDIYLGQGTYNLGDTDAPSFMLLFTGAGSGLYNGYGGTSIEWGRNPDREVLKLAFGATINAGAASSWSTSYGYLTKSGSGPWAGGADAYAPLRIDQGSDNYNYGWVSINYDTTGPTATISGFAFEDQINTPIEAGAIPEPSTYALLALAGLFGAVVWHHHRQKVGAPTELLQLAAGARGVEKFRADKAA